MSAAAITTTVIVGVITTTTRTGKPPIANKSKLPEPEAVHADSF
jgi:hypothetical protein